MRPGMRIEVKDFTYPQNMRTGSPAFANIGVSLHGVVFSQIWRRYGIPAGMTTAYPSSKIPDFQCGYEKAIIALIAALSGINLQLVQGAIHGELTHHPVQAIIDDDLVGMIGRFLEGVEVSDETIALDLITQVGPIRRISEQGTYPEVVAQRAIHTPSSRYPDVPRMDEKGKELPGIRQRRWKKYWQNINRPPDGEPGEDIEKILEDAQIL
jgi:hypothetical protein